MDNKLGGVTVVVESPSYEADAIKVFYGEGGYLFMATGIAVAIQSPPGFNARKEEEEE